MNRLTAYCFFFCLVMVSMSSQANAQQVNFIHTQTENNQYYEVDWNGKTFTSSQTGYLVVPQLPAGSHTILIRFSPETVTEYTFTIEITDKPRSFSLRQAIDNSWSLFDLVDLTLLKGTFVVPKPVEVTQAPEILPKVVPEEKPVDKKAADKSVEKPVDKPVAKLPDPVLTKKEPLVTIKERPTIKPNAIQKIFDKSSNSGVDQVYVITNGSRLDTIALFIPVIDTVQPKTGTEPSALKPFLRRVPGEWLTFTRTKPLSLK